jgi:hypothetical protein
VTGWVIFARSEPAGWVHTVFKLGHGPWTSLCSVWGHLENTRFRVFEIQIKHFLFPPHPHPRMRLDLPDVRLNLLIVPEALVHLFDGGYVLLLKRLIFFHLKPRSVRV